MPLHAVINERILIYIRGADSDDATITAVGDSIVTDYEFAIAIENQYNN